MFFHRNFTSQHTQDISKFCWAAVQMFLLCTFLRGIYSLRCQRKKCEQKKTPWSLFFFPSTTGHIGELFGDGHMLCSLLMKTPQAAFGEAHCTGRRLYWKLKQQRLLKSASGTMRQSWQLVIHGGFHSPCPVTISAYLPLSLCFHFSVIQCAIFITVCLFNALEQSNEFREKTLFKKKIKVLFETWSLEKKTNIFW